MNNKTILGNQGHDAFVDHVPTIIIFADPFCEGFGGLIQKDRCQGVGYISCFLAIFI
jgi:hypothetical protein